jgi:integrase/recombinase XerD
VKTKTLHQHGDGQGELAEAKALYLNWMTAAGYSDYVIVAAEFDIRLFNEFLAGMGIKRLAQVTPQTLRAFVAHDAKRPNPVALARTVGDRRHLLTLVAIRNFFHWLLAKDMIAADPTSGLGLPAHERPEKIILPPSGVQRLLNAPDLNHPLGYRDRAILELLYSTGITRHELMALKVDDVDIREKQLHVGSLGKGKKARLLPLSASAAGYLDEYLKEIRPMFANGMRKDTGCLFVNNIGTCFNRYDFTYVFSRAIKRAGMKKTITATTLRNSLAAHLLDKGMSVRAIQEFLGRHNRR